jgi:hypothetical protein
MKDIEKEIAAIIEDMKMGDRLSVKGGPFGGDAVIVFSASGSDETYVPTKEILHVWFKDFVARYKVESMLEVGVFAGHAMYTAQEWPETTGIIKGIVTRCIKKQRDAAHAEASWWNWPEQLIDFDRDPNPDGHHVDYYTFPLSYSDTRTEPILAETKWGRQLAYAVRKTIEAVKNDEPINLPALEALVTKIEEETR